MGIFEKSIPKYVVNPIDRTVEVAPQEVYVDDIFDPIFNANVRNAMRQKYGDGLYGIAGGYSELLNNAWGGEGGALGKGMGVLSTFGRSMEKADDLVLGLLTEGVEGISGQGFDNPLKQIFVEDQDYTGKRFLASTANIFRNLAGTTITEQDLGTAWNVPALGVELGTDVGILGGGLARKFAPTARKLTSKELFQNLGKSGLKTTVGEVGQLMSNYDDLMAKVAIDITAPGLRPAFKKLGNKLAQYVQTHSPKEFVDYTIIKNNPEVRKAAAEYYQNDATSQMLDNVIKTTDEIPVTESEAVEQVYKSPYQVAQELNDTEALEMYKFIKSALESGDYAKIDDEVRKASAEKGAEISAAYRKGSKGLSKGVGQLLERMQASGIPIDRIGVEQSTDDLVTLANNFNNREGSGLEFLYSLRSNGQSIDDLVRRRDNYEIEYYNTGSTRASRNLDSLEHAISTVYEAQASLDEVRKIITNTVPSVNKEYAEEILSKLDNDLSLIDALRTGEWTTNDAANKTIEAALGNPSYKQSVWYDSANPKYRISPSRLTKLDEFGNIGVSLAHLRLDAARYFLRDPNKVRFSNLEELDKFLRTAQMEETIKHIFPRAEVDEVRQLLRDVYFPKAGTDVTKYTANLEKLSELLGNSKLIDLDGTPLKFAPNESMFFNDIYKAFDDVDPITGEMYGIDQIYLQRIRDEFPSSRGVEYGSSQNSVKGIRDDESMSLVSYLKTILSQVSPHIKTDEDLKYFIEPVLDYVQVKPGHTLGKLDEVREHLHRTTGIAKDKLPEHLITDELSRLRLTPSQATLDTVSNFKSDAFLKIRSYVNTYGDYTKLPPKGSPPEQYKAFYEVRQLLGFRDNPRWLEKYGLNLAPNPDGYVNRTLFETLIDRRTGKSKVPRLSKYEVNLLLEDTAMRANLSKKLGGNSELEFKDEFAEIIDKYRKEPVTSKNASEAAEDVKATLANETPETVSKQAYEPISVSEAAIDEVIDKTAKDVDGFIENGGTPEAAKTIFGERKWNLYEQIQKARAVPRTNAQRAGRATLRTKVAEALGKAFTAVTGKARPEDFKRFYKIRSKQAGDVVKGSDFWTTFRRSGMLAVPYEKGSDMIASTQKTLTKNANIINEAAGTDIVEVVTYNLDNGNVAVVMRWNGNKQTAKIVKDAQQKLDAAVFDDAVFTKPSALTTEEQAFMNTPAMRELSGLMEQLQVQAADQARYLGFNFDSTSPYTKHAMRHDPETAMWLNNNFYTKMSSEDYDTVSRLISDFDGYRQSDRGTFGTVLQERRFRGDYWLLDNKAHPLFEYSPDKVFTSTLGDGIFANLQYQSFVDLFVNDNFKIKEWFKTPEDLKKVLYATTADGKVSGNLQNLELVSFKTDANGRIVGLTKFDKMSDEGLAKALADENTILVPTNAVSHMDNILRKDIRMGNKFWSFINKHFTIPFKFGLLSNPGFLLGNVSDSTLKLATTMSEKYGTSMAEEAANAAESVNTVIHLKNTYSDVFKDWLNSVDENGIKLPSEARIPEVVAMSPKYKDMFLQYLNGDLKIKKKDPVTKKWEEVPVMHGLLKEQVDEARVYMMLQDMQMNSNKLREYSELADLEKVSDFEVPYNIWDRVTQGKGKYSWKKPSTWGLFMNNPIMKGFTDVSGSWEELIRTASIVDDLKHKRYTIEQMSEYSKYVDPGLGEARRQFDVHLEEAKNTMFNAQFDYERVNDFLSGVGKVVPFPIFFLKNFQYWMDLFMKNPQWVDNAIDVQEGLWSGYNEGDDKFMKEAKGRGAVPVGGKALPDWFRGVYKPSPLQSMFGAFNLLNSPVDNLTYRVNPLVSGAATAAANVLPTNDLTTYVSDPDSVKYRPYSTDMYERNVRFGDENFNPLEYTLHRMNPFDRAVSSYMRIPEKVKAEEAQLSDALPSVFQPIF